MDSDTPSETTFSTDEWSDEDVDDMYSFSTINKCTVWVFMYAQHFIWHIPSRSTPWFSRLPWCNYFLFQQYFDNLCSLGVKSSFLCELEVINYYDNVMMISNLNLYFSLFANIFLNHHLWLVHIIKWVCVCCIPMYFNVYNLFILFIDLHNFCNPEWITTCIFCIQHYNHTNFLNIV